MKLQGNKYKGKLAQPASSKHHYSKSMAKKSSTQVIETANSGSSKKIKPMNTMPGSRGKAFLTPQRTPGMSLPGTAQEKINFPKISSLTPAAGANF
jgi:hypothetical protein